VPTKGLIGKVEVILNLPKEFTKERGSCIDFYIYPEKQRIEIGYEILDLTTGQISVMHQVDLKQ
jgi:hypothetical protein